MWKCKIFCLSSLVYLGLLALLGGALGCSGGEENPTVTPQPTSFPDPDETPTAAPSPTAVPTPSPTPQPTPTAIPPGTGMLELDATVLSFGEVFVDKSSILSILIGNGGDGPLQIRASIDALEGGTYSLGVSSLSFSIGPDSVFPLYVSFTPGEPGLASAKLVLESSDPSQPEVHVDLTGTGILESPDDQDGDGFGLAVDCDDADPTTYPGAAEPCDGIDNDCDGQLDEEGASPYYTDLDGDGYGDSSTLTQTCDPDPEQVSQAGDCDDQDATIHPEGVEQCDGIDNNCDAQVDENVKLFWYRDSDRDGYGTASDTQQACTQPAGYVSTMSDCDDLNNTINPSGVEKCDGLDNDCDGNTDNGVGTVYYEDSDADSHGNSASSIQSCTPITGYSTSSLDCDDTQSSVHPGAPESCNGIDDDCDTQIDENVTNTYYTDSDRDGFGNPAQAIQACSAPNGTATLSGDCDDFNNSIYPGAVELCDLRDNDCDGTTDEGVGETWYRDSDGDGYGSPANTSQACSRPSGYVGNALDCNDSNAGIYPSALELCNGLDDDCDTLVDEGVTQTYYRDDDLDGYGDPITSKQACSTPSGYVQDKTDCNDRSAAVNPAATELCDGIDQDCDGAIDEGVLKTFYRDGDGDGYGTDADTIQACSAPVGYVNNASDCNDSNSNAHPGAAESVNNIDDDCNGVVDDFPANCKAILATRPGSTSGVYTVDPDGPSGALVPIQAYCDMVTEGGGWTLLGRTVLSGLTSAERDLIRLSGWTVYTQTGYGSPDPASRVYWMPLRYWSSLTLLGPSNLFWVKTNGPNSRVINLSVLPESGQYVWNWSGVASGYSDIVDGATRGMKFTTFDADNDIWTSNCAKDNVGSNGGWWYSNCYQLSMLHANNSLYAWNSNVADSVNVLELYFR